MAKTSKFGFHRPVAPRSRIHEVIEKGDILYDAKTGEVVASLHVDDEPPDYAEEILKLPGLVTDIANHVLQAAQVPQPRFAVAVGLTVVGMAVARRLTPTRSKLNTYMLLITQTGNGKDDPLTGAKAILRAAGLSEMIGPAGGNSDIGVYLHCDKHPTTLMVIDEFGDVLVANNSRNAQSYAHKLNAVYKIMWGGGQIPVPKAACREHVVLNDPYLSMLCAATPGNFMMRSAASTSRTGR